MNKKILELDADCANCGQPAVAGSTLCVDCLVSCNVKLLIKNTSLQEQIDIDGYNASTIIGEKEDELICLRLQLSLTRRVMRHVFAEYQKLQKLQGDDGGKKG